MQKVNLASYENTLGFQNQLLRLLWGIVWFLFAKPLPRSLGNNWKLFLLRCFGAKLAPTAVVYSSAKIFMPWNLEILDYGCLGPEVDCYNVAKITIGAHTTVSQKCYLCSATHDITKSNNPLMIEEIKIHDQAWIAADAFVGPGVTIGQGAVIAARAVVVKNVEPWTIVGGNPAKFIKERKIEN